MLVRLITGALFSASIAFFALSRRSLTPRGAWAAWLTGTGIYVGLGDAGFVALCTFFFTSTALAKVGRAQKAPLAKDYEKGDRRDEWQVLANGGVALFCALCARSQPAFAWAFLGALATAAGDTWATELGVLAKGEPYSLRTFTRVPRGTSGAVSALGLGATFAGGACVGLAYGVFAGSPLACTLYAGLFGLLGALVDSLLGAFLQARHYCDACQRACEGTVHGCGATTRNVGGHVTVNNDVVNASATLAGALIGALLGT